MADLPDSAFPYRAFRCPDYRCLVFLTLVFLCLVFLFQVCRYPACLYRVYLCPVCPCPVCPTPDFRYWAYPFPDFLCQVYLCQVYPCPACRCRACLCLDCRAVPVYLVLCRADLDSDLASVSASVLSDSVEPAGEFRVGCPVPTVADYRVGCPDVADDNCLDDNANSRDIPVGLPTRWDAGGTTAWAAGKDSTILPSSRGCNKPGALPSSIPILPIPRADCRRARHRCRSRHRN